MEFEKKIQKIIADVLNIEPEQDYNGVSIC